MISCPKCGREVVIGQACVCASNVPRANVLNLYRVLSAAFLVLGIVYLLMAAVASSLLKAPMIGYGIHGLISFVHGLLLLMRVEWVEDRTRIISLYRLGLVVFMLMYLVPFFTLVGWIGYALLGLLLTEGFCAWKMSQVIEDVVFPG